MSSIYRESFEKGGKQYEVRAAQFEDEWQIKVFHDGQPLNAVIASVSNEVAVDAAVTGVPDLIKRAVEIVKTEFINEGPIKLAITIGKASAGQ